MKNSSAPAGEDSPGTEEKLKGTDIELPDAPGFVSLRPKLELAAAVQLNETLLPLVNSRPGEMERRRREKVTAPFEL